MLSLQRFCAGSVCSPNFWGFIYVNGFGTKQSKLSPIVSQFVFVVLVDMGVEWRLNIQSRSPPPFKFLGPEPAHTEIFSDLYPRLSLSKIHMALKLVLNNLYIQNVAFLFVKIWLKD